MLLDRTPAEFTRHVKRLEALAQQLAGAGDDYAALMEEFRLDHLTYVEVLERVVLLKSGGAD